MLAANKAWSQSAACLHHKSAVLTLVERGGSARSFHVESVRQEDVLPIIRANLARESLVMTDEAKRSEKLGDEFAKHDAVDHSAQRNTPTTTAKLEP